MKKISIRNFFLAITMAFTFSSCGGGSSLLSSGSSLLSSLGSSPNLSTITGLLQTPGLSDLLGPSLKGPFTLLAPSNDAIAGLGANAIAGLTKPENISQLAGVLTKHIVPGKLDAAGLAQAGLKTAGGNALDLSGIKLGDMISGKKFNVIPIDKVLK